jgi:(2Fe-2S) ferredoxin
MAIYPDGYWYGQLNEERLEKVLDALAENQPVPEYLLTSQ